MEACVGAHDLARSVDVLGHDVPQMVAKYARQLCGKRKNDFNDRAGNRRGDDTTHRQIRGVESARAARPTGPRERLISQRTGVITVLQFSWRRLALETRTTIASFKNRSGKSSLDFIDQLFLSTAIAVIVDTLAAVWRPRERSDHADPKF